MRFFDFGLWSLIFVFSLFGEVELVASSIGGNRDQSSKTQDQRTLLPVQRIPCRASLKGDFRPVIFCMSVISGHLNGS